MKPVLLDVLIDGRFYTQVRYDKRGYPMLVDGEIIEVHKEEDLYKFAEEKLPSLKGKNYQLEFANKPIFR